MKKNQVEDFFARLKRARPEPRGELDYRDPYTLLVAVVLSAQATDVGVNKATEPLFEVVDTPAEDAGARRGEAESSYIKTIGLFNTKAKNVIALSQILVEKHGGEVPRDREALESTAGRRAQDRQRGAERRLRRADHRRRHAYLPRRQPHRPGARQDAAGGRAEAGGACRRNSTAARASLADPARPLRLQGAEAGLLALRGGRFVPLQGQRAGGAGPGSADHARAQTGLTTGRPKGNGDDDDHHAGAGGAAADFVLLYFIKKDKFREPTKYILATFFFGWAIIIPVLVIALLMQAIFAGIGEPVAASFVSAFFGAGVPEELCKLMVPILYAMRRPAFDEAMDGIVYGVTVSLGFATFENILYVLQHGFEVALLRAFTPNSDARFRRLHHGFLRRHGVADAGQARQIPVSRVPGADASARCLRLADSL